MDAPLREIALLLADGKTSHFRAALGRVFGKAAPAAADLQQLLIGAKIDRLCKPAVFVVLRGGQVRRVVFI